jgi:hypothetical protein
LAGNVKFGAKSRDQGRASCEAGQWVALHDLAQQPGHMVRAARHAVLGDPLRLDQAGDRLACRAATDRQALHEMCRQVVRMGECGRHFRRTTMPLVSMRQLLDHAAENGYGIPAFNVNNLEQVQAVMTAADEIGAPVILQASAGARKYAGEPSSST